jgi:methylmalonyl-CoA mutase
MTTTNVNTVDAVQVNRQIGEPATKEPPYRPTYPVRFITATSLFDGHDASINIMRRILQSSGVEVIHLGHNRSVDEIVTAAIQEDVQGIAVSSYQGGHMEFFKYMYDLLQERGAPHIRIFGGGGGVIVPEEAAELERYGIAKIFSSEDGRRMGLQGMINHMIRLCDFPTPKDKVKELTSFSPNEALKIAQLISQFEVSDQVEELRASLQRLSAAQVKPIPVLGITGVGGAGKSSLADELIARFLEDFPDKTVAVFAIDPTRQRTGGALLGDRIRMNAIHNPRVYMRSLSTRRSNDELSHAIRDVVLVAKAAGFDLIIIETSGIGQGDAAIVQVADVSAYVMTAEFGAPSQLEKIEMLDYADIVLINKFDRRGSQDALDLVRKQVQRNRQAFHVPKEEMPVYGTIASQFQDAGTNISYRRIIDRINEKCGTAWQSRLSLSSPQHMKPIIPMDRTHYLLDIVNTVKEYHRRVDQQAEWARNCGHIAASRALLANSREEVNAELLTALDRLYAQYWEKLPKESQDMLTGWEAKKQRYRSDYWVSSSASGGAGIPLYTKTLSGTSVPKVALPSFSDWGDILRWSLTENVPGEFPYTAGVFPLKLVDEEPTRMFAGEGTPERTNRRFHYLSQGQSAKRLSTAFDSVTLYGEDPDYRPDIYGKIGESGVSICTLDDMKKLFSGFDLCAPNTSVSMTINGPAPIILAMFFNVAIDQQMEALRDKLGRDLTPDERLSVKRQTLERVRGTVQADILKEDQGQNTCIFSIDFALRMMGDMEEYFVKNHVKNFYSVSISGYHIAEAGANPITQLAFTLANAFTYVEYYLSRGLPIDEFAPHLSFFFSNGMDPEYSVIGRVARRIWAVVMKYRYGANERSQKLKYHIQTSGRSLHAQEIEFNDIRTTLQALMAIFDNCNSLHTNAYDEAITTPTEDSVRRALAIQLIINREYGLAKNENPLQGSFVIEELTHLVEEAVLKELARLNERGGVLGAMELQYQRNKIQEESLLYEQLKHSGQLPIIGVNTFLNPKSVNDLLPEGHHSRPLQLVRSSDEEKQAQIRHLKAFQERHAGESGEALNRLKEVARRGGNIFEELMQTVRVATLGQITHALYEVGGYYRRNM